MSFEFEGEFEGESHVTVPAEPGPSPRELALASRLLELESEQELQGFLPFLIGPAIAGLKALAVPALKMIGAKVLPKLGGALVKRVGRMVVRRGARAVGDIAKQSLERRRSAEQQRARQRALQEAARRRAAGSGQQGEQFLGSIVGGLFGEQEQEHEQFLGNIVGGLFGEQEQEHEQFLGNIVSGLFGEQELEGFLGGIVGSLFGEVGEMTQAEAELETAVWFVRLAEDAAMRAAGEILRRRTAGRPLDAATLQSIIRLAITNSGRLILPAAGISGEFEGELEISKDDLRTLKSLANQIAQKLGHTSNASPSKKGKHQAGIARKAQDILNSALRAIKNGESVSSVIARLQARLDSMGELEGEAMHLDTAIGKLGPGEAGVYTLSRRNGKSLLSFSVGQSGDVRTRLQKHKNLIERLCGDSKDILVTFKKTPTLDAAQRRTEEQRRRAARVKAQGGVPTRDLRELEMLEMEMAMA